MGEPTDLCAMQAIRLAAVLLSSPQEVGNGESDSGSKLLKPWADLAEKVTSVPNKPTLLLCANVV